MSLPRALEGAHATSPEPHLPGIILNRAVLLISILQCTKNARCVRHVALRKLMLCQLMKALPVVRTISQTLEVEIPTGRSSLINVINITRTLFGSTLDNDRSQVR